MEIECGHLRWGDSFQNLQVTTLAGGFLRQDEGSTQRSGNGYDSPVVFCKKYQRGTCDEDNDHFGEFSGQQRYLRHICAKCWLTQRKKAPHPEMAEDCPSKEE